MHSRRSLLGFPALGLLASNEQALSTPVESTSVISQQPTLYHGWSTLAQDRAGRLLVVCSGGRESHVCPFGRVELIRSYDQGRTWTWPEVLMDTAIDDRDAGICVTPAGTLLVTTFTSLAYEKNLHEAKGWPAEKLARWRAAHNRVGQAQRNELLGTWMLRSTDGGLTWSAPYRVSLNSPHGAIAVSGGRLLYAGKELWTPEQRVGMAESTDDGVSWRWLSTIPARAGDDPRAYHELHAVEATPGRIVVHIRNHNQKNARETLQCESSDGGRTWSEPHSIGVWGLPSHLLKLRDGRLLMTYGYRREPFGNQARLSEDGGATWQAPLTISADGASGDLGYPSTVELGNGVLITVWYERLAGSPQAVLRMARWSLS